MPSKEEIRAILLDALAREKLAEENCQHILDFAYLNGFTRVIEKIRNDEARHQEIVKKLLELLKKQK